MQTIAPAPSTSTGQPDALVVNGVSHSFGDKRVLDNVSLTVPRGTFAVLLGLNGAGKSTLFSLITRLYDNISGEIRILGSDVRRKPGAALQRLGVVFQSKTVDSDLSLQQNLLYHAALHGIGRRDAKRRAVEALTTVGLADRAHEKVRNLSGGQSRRVEIARSLMHRPGCLLLDEPTVGLDIGSRESVINIVRGLVQREGLGVLWATHLIDEIAETDQIVVLHKGKVMFTGRLPGFLEHTGASSPREAFRILTGTTSSEESA
ncbi:MAG TPA: ABC transporter ATP-binding protein [Hyphomicrobium sp.]|nr:ABC transporter ATP-binding protein [Hyphomicrobium sp.]HEX2841124.1 ABC transporter ATP-binding protein [Hyphomicrobium sp.]